MEFHFIFGILKAHLFFSVSCGGNAIIIAHDMGLIWNKLVTILDKNHFSIVVVGGVYGVVALVTAHRRDMRKKKWKRIIRSTCVRYAVQHLWHKTRHMMEYGGMYYVWNAYVMPNGPSNVYFICQSYILNGWLMDVSRVLGIRQQQPRMKGRIVRATCDKDKRKFSSEIKEAQWTRIVG